MTYPTLTQPCICGCGGGPCIPQREYERQRTDPLSQTDLQEMILFRVQGKCGYPLKHALRKQYTGLVGRDDKMFEDSKSSISIRLEVRLTSSARFDDGLESCSQWLPYGRWTKQVGTESRVPSHGY
jgi:hypothetical protein